MQTDTKRCLPKVSVALKTYTLAADVFGGRRIASILVFSECGAYAAVRAGLDADRALLTFLNAVISDRRLCHTPCLPSIH